MNEPVKLSEIIDAMDSRSDETSAYLNKETVRCECITPRCQFDFITAWLSGMIRFIQDYRGNENKV